MDLSSFQRSFLDEHRGNAWSLSRTQIKPVSSGLPLVIVFAISDGIRRDLSAEAGLGDRVSFSWQPRPGALGTVTAIVRMTA